MHTDQVSLPLVKAVYEATGVKPHVSTTIRWCLRKNQFGNTLESWMVGGRRMTSVEAVLRFLAANTAAADPSQIRSAPTPSNSSAHKLAMAALESEGV